MEAISESELEQILTRELFFEVLAHVVAVHAVAIAHGEEMQSQLIQHVGHEDVGVLILLVWVSRLVAHGRGVGELGDAIEPFT